MNDNVIQLRPATPPVVPPSRRTLAYNTVVLAGGDGVIWKDLAARYGWHHGSCSGVLSSLHRDGRIDRLTEKRDGCLLYVLPMFAWGRATRPYGSSTKTDLIHDMAALIESLPPCTHTDSRGMKCRGCQRARLLARYAEFSN